MFNEHSNSSPPAINPYAATLVDEPRKDPAVADQTAVSRNFRVRMDWADRRSFLRVVGLLRIAAVAGAVLGFSGLYSMVGNVYESWRLGSLATWSEPLTAIRWLAVFAKAALGFYVCWLQWIFADALAATAGGTTSSMHEWSRIQLRLAWLVVITLGINMASLAWDWLVIQLMSKTPFGV